jgi:CheY-like chemotaxis protein
MMPEMDGYDAIRAIRCMGCFDDLTIVAITGNVAAGELERCMAAGANDYVPKPVNTLGLLSVLQPWMPARELTP